MSKNKILLRQKRNRQYEEMTKEISEAGLNLSEIKVEDFADSRRKEMDKFLSILSSKFSSKNGHQLLPKHMRRRQMSHNPFRIPRRNRLSNLKVKTKSKCKKQKRKLKNLRLSIIRRAFKQNWIESHLWLAKRFVMKKFLDTYTIPYKCRDKGYRACYKFWQYHACIHDCSYYDYVIIKLGNAQSIRQILESIQNNMSMLCNVNEHFIFNQEKKMFFFDLFNKTSQSIIGPVKMFYCEKLICFMVLPYITQEVFDAIRSNLKLTQEDNAFISRMNSFKVFGKFSLEKIFSVLKSCEDSQNNHLFDDFETFERYFSQGENGLIKPIKINTPTSRFKMNEFVFRKAMCQVFKEEKYNEKSSCPMDEESDNYMTEFLNFFEPSSKTIELKNKEDLPKYFSSSLFRETERTTFMHRKKVDLDKLNDKIKDTISEWRQKHLPVKLQKKAEKKEEENVGNKKTKEKKVQKIELSTEVAAKEILSTPKPTYILIVKEVVDANYAFYYVIFPTGYAPDFLRRFSYANTKVVGMKEHNLYLSQLNQDVFPNDYPGTLSYKKYILNRAQTKLKKYFKRSPKHRENYQCLKNPSPFYPSWNYIKYKTPSPSISSSLDNIHFVTHSLLQNQEKIKKFFSLVNARGEKMNYLLKFNFITKERGVPAFNDLICLPNEEDIQLYLKYKSNVEKINKGLFGDDKEVEIDDINIVSETTKNFTIKEEHGRPTQKNNYFNTEMLSVLEYYNCTAKGEEKALTNKIINRDFTLQLESEPGREIIGFVSSGIYDYESHVGKGKCFISIEKFELVAELKNKYKLSYLPCLLRNKKSLIYYVIELIK